MAARKWNPAYHPRGKGGRFTRSATRVMSQADRNRGRKSMEGFKPAGFGNAGEGRDYLEKIGPDAPSGAAARYLDGDWRDVNTALRAGKHPDGVDEIDQQMQPLPDGLMLRRQVPLALFAHVPMKELEGMKVRDAAYASTSLDVSGHEPGGADTVTMHIAAPKGTPALVNADDGEILLARDTEVAITRVEPNGRGGWDVYGAVLPKAKKRSKATPPADDTAGTPADDGKTGPPAGGEPGQGSSSPDPASEPQSTPSEPAPAPAPAPAANPEPGPATPAPSGGSTPPASVDDRIRGTITDLLSGDGLRPGDLVSLARLRDELSDISRADLDAALLRLDRERVIQLEPDPNRKALSDRAKAAAIPLGGEDMHLVAIIRPLEDPQGSQDEPGSGSKSGTAATNPGGSVSPGVVDDRIRDAINAIIARNGGQSGDLVRLTQLRDELGDLDRADVDAALLRLDRARVIQLDPDPDRINLTPQDKDAAIRLGPEDKHLVSLD